jgi:pilus assembly protein TadC
MSVFPQKEDCAGDRLFLLKRIICHLNKYTKLLEASGTSGSVKKQIRENLKLVLELENEAAALSEKIKYEKMRNEVMGSLIEDIEKSFLVKNKEVKYDR